MAAVARRPKLNGLRLYDFSDVEFLAICLDAAGDEGWFETQEITRRLNLDVEQPNSNVGIRLAWLRRYGVVERNTVVGSEYRFMWRLTPEGEAAVTARLNSNQERVLDNLGVDQMLEVTAFLTGRYRRGGKATKNLVRRQWLYGTHPEL